MNSDIYIITLGPSEEITHGTFGCFAKDQHNRIFALTAKHILSKSDEQLIDGYHVYLRKGLLCDSDYLNHHTYLTWNKYYGVCDKFKVKGRVEKVVIDVALLLLCDKTISDKLESFHIKPIDIFPPEDDEINDGDNVSSDDDEDDDSESSDDGSDDRDNDFNYSVVTKYGCRLGLTKGIVITTYCTYKQSKGTFVVVNADVNEHGQYELNDNKMFAETGDSGALVTLEQNGSAIGIIHKICKGFSLPGNGKFTHATLCVRLDYCREIIQNKWGLQIQLFDKMAISNRDINKYPGQQRRRTISL